MVTLRRGPGRQPHKCAPPIRPGSFDEPSEPIGSVWQCDECGRQHIVVTPPLVERGMQRVPPMWRLARRGERIPRW